LAPSADAQAFGRVKFIVKTAGGEPVQGVEIAVTSPELGNFDKVIETNKKGEAILSVVDATKIYHFAIDHEGSAIEGDLRPKIRETLDQEIVLGSGSVQTAPSPEATLTPAEETFNEGVAAVQAGDVAAAKAKFLESIERDANLSAAHHALASLYLEEEDYESTARHAGHLAELEPNNTRAWRMLHEAHTALGHAKEAKEAMQRLSDLGAGGDTAAVFYNEGVSSLRVGDAATAKANFLKALELQPDLIQAMAALALVYYQEGSYAEAAGIAEKFLATGGDGQNDEKVLRLRWESYRALGDTAKEKEAFDALAAANPKVLVDDLFKAGAKLFESGNAEGARESFEKVLALDPDHPRAHYQLALCLISSDAEAAKMHLSRFLELAPDDPEAPAAKEMLSYLEK
jgi:Tfp pilus assembly protein PilF